MTGGKPRSKSTTGLIAPLKKELDRVFSLYVRAVHPARCFTCGITTKRLQCGHFISRNYLATRYSEDNCRPQCWPCNGFAYGRYPEFEERLIAEIGLDRVNALKKQRHEITILTPEWYENKIAHYKALLEQAKRP